MRISSNGAYQVNKLSRYFVYLDAIIVDLPIFDKEVRRNVRSVFLIQDRLERARIVLKYLDDLWSGFDFQDTYFNWLVISDDIKSDIESISKKITLE